MEIDIEHIINNINQLLADREWNEVEYKGAKGGFPGSFWDTYSSFANTEGGIIILGISEKDNIFYADGLEEDKIEKYRRDFWNMVNNPAHVNRNILKEDDVIPFSCEGQHFLLFRIPACERTQKPIYRTTNPYNGTFKRNYEGDYKCTEEEVRRMFADANVDTPPDSRILPNYTMDDIDIVSLEQYRRLMGNSKPSHPWLALNNLELLEKLGGYRKERTTGEEGFTLAGLLMFGKMESITDTACAPHYFPDYKLYAAEDSSLNTRWIDRICPDGTWEANLFQFYRRVLPQLTSTLPKPFRLDEDTRIDETSAHVAVREALINLCIHTDYSINASLLVYQYPNRIELSNPGTLLVSREQYYKGGESVCRNISIQKMFTMLGKAEKAGSGVDEILKGWHEKNWKKPYILTSNRPDKVTLYLFMESLLPAEVKEKLNESFGKERMADVGYNKLMALSVACTEGVVSNERLQYMLDMHKSDISAMLKQLCLEGMLVAEGHGRGTKYRLRGKSMPTLNGSIPTSDGSIPTSENTLFEKQGKRLRKEEVYQTILNYCALEYRSLSEIAKFLKKNEQYVKNHYLKMMLKEDLLQKMFPHIPHHPGQKYKARN